VNPSLLPDLAHLPVMVGVAAVALICIGIGSWVGARRAETALVAGWGVASAATVAVGTLTNSRLPWVMLVLAVAGFGGIARIVVAHKQGAPILRFDMAGRILLLGLPFLACIEGMETTGWDDFSHWVPNLVYLCVHGHFPTLAEPSTSAHAAYPYALALPGYAYFLLSGSVPDNAELIWNALLMLAAGAAVAAVLQARLPKLAGQRAQHWAAAAIGLLIAGLACPSFVPKITLSNMADASSGSVLAVLGLMLFEWVGAIQDGDVRARNRIAWALAFASIAFVDLRQANAALFAWLVFGCLLAGGLRRRWLGFGELLSLSLVVLAPFIVWLLWNRYTGAQIPGGQFAFLPLKNWRWAEFPDTLHSMLRVMLSKIGLFGLVAIITARAVLAFRVRDDLDAPSRTVLITAAVVCLCNIAFLAFTYLAADFSDSEAAAAVSFWRYAGQMGPLAVLGFIAGVPLNWTRRIPAVPSAMALVALALILPIATVRLYRADLASPVPMLRSAGQATAAAIPAGAPIELVDLTGNGFAPFVVAYQIRATDRGRGEPPRRITTVAWPTGIPPVDAAKKIDFAAAPFLWLTEGAPEMDQLFGAKLNAGCSYLLRRETDHFAIMMSWQLSPYLKNPQREGWSSAAQPAPDTALK
jgi:hypothetical protein